MTELARTAAFVRTALARVRTALTCAAMLAGASLGMETARAQDIVDVVAPLRFYMGSSTDSLSVPYYASHPLEGELSDLTRAVIVIHGTLRNADDYFQSIVDAAASAGDQGDSTLILAPQFLTEDDVDHHDLSADVLFWEYMGWRQGDPSLTTPSHPRPWAISSFAVVDSLLIDVRDRCPDLTTIVVAGHSAGGQFVNRFAAGSPTPELLDLDGIAVRHIVSNPSTNLAFDNRRWRPGSSHQFEIPFPSALAACPGYDDYKYGLRNPNPYMSLEPDLIRQRFRSQEIVYLLGGYDDDPLSFYLDRDCPAMFHGIERRQRGLSYMQHLESVFGLEILERQEVVLVPAVGHDQRGMFTSACGVLHLFDHGACNAVPISGNWVDVTTESLYAIEARAPAFGDYDRDGDPDLYVAGEGTASVLLRNEGDGNFADVTTIPLAGNAPGMVAAWGDFDGDRDLDLFVANDTEPNRLYRNDGGGSFADVASGDLADAGEYRDAEWADIENDGDLDLLVCRAQGGGGNRLFRNDGAAGFTDVADGPLDDHDETQGVAFGDYDGDGDLDLYLVNDGPNRLLRNDGLAEFVDLTSQPLDDPGHGSSAVWGDFDGDLDLDLYLTNRLSPNRLFRNDGAALFANVTSAPLGYLGNSRSAACGDVDNDGDLDLYLSVSGQSNRLFRNEGGGLFADATEFPIDERRNTFGAAFADVDADGWIDLYVGTDSGPNRLYRNNGASANHWLALGLLGTVSNSWGVGAHVRIVAGGHTQIRSMGGGAGTASQSPLVVHVGLGAATIVDTLEIRWPSGIVQTVGPLPVDQRFTIQELEGSLEVALTPAASVGGRLSPAWPNPFRGSTAIEWEIAQPAVVTLVVHDVGGRLVRTLVPPGRWPAGAHRALWDGQDERGRSVGAGVYFCRLYGVAGSEADKLRSLVVLR